VDRRRKRPDGEDREFWTAVKGDTAGEVLALIVEGKKNGTGDRVRNDVVE